MFKKFMEKNWMIGKVRVYLWPFVFVAVVAGVAPLINFVIHGNF